MRRLLPLLLLAPAGCFQDAGPDGFSDTSGTDENSSSTALTGDEVTSVDDPGSSEGDTSGTDSPTASETGSLSEGGTTESSGESSDSGTTSGPETGTDTASGTGAPSTSGDGCAPPVEVPVDGEFEQGETRTLYLDFDGFPGVPGESAELCMTFWTPNTASSRTVTIGGVGGEVLVFGPCRPVEPDPPPFTGCSSYLKPAGLTEVIIDNTTPTPGCQNGRMDDVILRFGCLP